MRILSLIVVFVWLLVCPKGSYGQKSHVSTGSLKNVTFLVRNGDYIKNIAAKIKVPVHAILKANKLHSKQYLAYPGRKLIIPVHTQPRIWDPSKEEMTGSSPSREDRHAGEDYEVVIDTSNYKLAEDFINLTEAMEDSVEYENIGTHMQKIEKHIQHLYYQIDSIKQVDFKFDYEDQDKSSALGKMKLTRDKYYAEGPLGKQIDSLSAMKDWLGQRRIVLRNQVTEYEYLVENASYSEHNYRHEEREKPSDWGDHLAYETNYVKDKDNTIAKSQPKPQPISTLPKTEEPPQKPNLAPVSPVSMPVAKKEPTAAISIPDNNSGVEKKEVIDIDTTGAEEAPAHYKSDFSALPKQRMTEDIRGRGFQRTLITSLEEDLPAYKPLISPQDDAAKVGTKSIDREAPSIADKSEDTKMEQTKSVPPSITEPNQTSSSLNTRIDTFIKKPVEKINMDPLASYKSDSGFVNKANIKSVPIAEHKNNPKYLIPVDSVTRIKGDFYVIRARQALEKGDFKSGDKFLKKSLEINPNDAQAWMLHADLFLALGLADQSLKEYTIASEIDSTNPKVFYNIALLYTKANNNQKAYKYFSRAIEVNDKYLLAYMGRATLQMDEHDYEGAIKDYDMVLAKNKYYSPAFKARGIAKMEVRKFADAIADFNQYLEIEDPDGYVIYQRGISKIYSNSLLQGCLDLSSAQELGYKDAEKAIKKFCE